MATWFEIPGHIEAPYSAPLDLTSGRKPEKDESSPPPLLIKEEAVDHSTNNISMTALEDIPVDASVLQRRRSHPGPNKWQQFPTPAQVNIIEKRFLSDYVQL